MICRQFKIGERKQINTRQQCTWTKFVKTVMVSLKKISFILFKRDIKSALCYLKEE